MKEIREVKKLKSQLATMMGDADALKLEISNKQKEYNKKVQLIRELEKKIQQLEVTEELKVTEHAIIRYLERVQGLDVAEIEKKILSDQVIDLVKKLGGNGTYPNDGFRVVMKNHTVITVV